MLFRSDGSKWLDKNFTNVHRTGGYSDAYGQTTLLLTVDDSSGTPDMLDFFTGSNPNKRDPVSWQFGVYREDTDSFEPLSTVDSFVPTTDRDASYGTFYAIAPPYPPSPCSARTRCKGLCPNLS